MKKKFVLPLAPSIMTFCAIVALIIMGNWQISRLQWKTDLLSQIHKNVNWAPVPIDQVLEDLNPEKWRFRKVTMKGKFLNDLEVNLVPKALKGRPGYHLITPFQLDSGGVVLVNRGWVAQNKSYDAVSRTDKIVQLVGTISTSQRPGYFTPKNNFEKKEIFTIDVNDFAQSTSLMALLPFYIVAEPDEKVQAQFPKQVGMSLNIPNNHLVYAITWFLLAFAALIIYSIFVYQWNHRLRALNES